MNDTKKRTPTGGKLEQVYIARKNAPDVTFEGVLLNMVKSSTGSRWTQLELYQLPCGDWVAATMGMSDREGEVDIGDALRIPAGERSPEEMAKDALTFWGWTWLAKDFAEKMMWPTVETWA